MASFHSRVEEHTPIDFVALLTFPEDLETFYLLSLLETNL